MSATAWYFIALCILMLAVQMAFLFRKVIAVNSHRGQTRVPGPPSMVPRLDEAKLEEWSRQMTELGFVQVGEYLAFICDSRVTPGPVVAAPIAAPTAEPGTSPQRQTPSNFNRIFVHPLHGCLGYISMLTIEDARGKVAPKTWSLIGISSFSGMSESDWGYSTSSHRLPANSRASLKLLRKPRSLYNWIPDGAPDELLKVHLSRRDEIAHAAGVTWRSQPTLDEYYEFEDRALQEMRAFFSQITPLQLARRFYPLLFDKRKEWLGELEGRLPASQYT